MANNSFLSPLRGFVVLCCEGGGWQNQATHSVSDEVFKSASLDKLSDQIQPLVLVKHTDEPQNMGMIEASHDFDLKNWQKQKLF